MAARRGRKGQENTASKALDSSIPTETRVEASSGVRSSARIRNKNLASEASVPPTPQKKPTVPAQRKPARSKTKLSQPVPQEDEPEDVKDEPSPATVPPPVPAPAWVPAPAPAPAPAEKPAPQPLIQQDISKPLTKEPDKPDVPSAAAPKHLLPSTAAIDPILERSGFEKDPKSITKKKATEAWAKTQQAALKPVKSRDFRTPKQKTKPARTGSDEDFMGESDPAYSSFSDSDISLDESEVSSGSEPLMNDLLHRQRKRRPRRVRLMLPATTTGRQPGRLAAPGDESDLARVTLPRRTIGPVSLRSPSANRSTHKNRQDRAGQSSSSRMPRRDHYTPSDDSAISSTIAQLANKRAFWWAHIFWIIVCFLMALLLWTLALSIYWGNYFATVGPPAPCDMTTSTRPFPQTYAESFKIFRRPDVSWSPEARKQLEEFGNYVGADSWLMDNCILPRNIMKLPLVTCQEKLPWYNLTQAQVLWLNENNNWAFSLDLELTEKFNKVFDMQFELQELQISWMLSDHGPASVGYESRRCQACQDLLDKDKNHKEEPTAWWQLGSSKKPRDSESDPIKQLPNFEGFEELKKALVAEENPSIPIVEVIETDVPYWERTGSVGPDLMYTEADGSSWRPSDGGYTVLRTAKYR